jgi:hypothetical protein
LFNETIQTSNLDTLTGRTLVSNLESVGLVLDLKALSANEALLIIGNCLTATLRNGKINHRWTNTVSNVASTETSVSPLITSNGRLARDIECVSSVLNPKANSADRARARFLRRKRLLRLTTALFRNERRQGSTDFGRVETHKTKLGKVFARNRGKARKADAVGLVLDLKAKAADGASIIIDRNLLASALVSHSRDNSGA